MARIRRPDPAEPARPLIPTPTAQFRRDVKTQQKRGKNVDKLQRLIESLCDRRPLEPRQRNHPLGGDWTGWWDCHVEPDWILIYKLTETELILGRTGTHSDLFE